MNVIGILGTLMFCLSGPVVDGKCEDGSIPTKLEILIATAKDCIYESLTDCPIDNLLEIRRNDEVISVVPANILSDKERSLILDLFFSDHNRGK